MYPETMWEIKKGIAGRLAKILASSLPTVEVLER